MRPKQPAMSKWEADALRSELAKLRAKVTRESDVRAKAKMSARIQEINNLLTSVSF